MKTHQLTQVLLAAAALFAGAALGSVTNVTSGGAVFATIQAAVSAANNGDELRVSTGAYIGPVSISQKNLQIIGGWLPDFTTHTGDRAATAAIAGSPGPVFTVASNSVVLLQYMDIRGGTNLGGGGVSVPFGGVVTVRLCYVRFNLAFLGGGIAIGTNSTVVARDTFIVNNLALGGGGVYLESAGSSFTAEGAGMLIGDNYGGSGGGIVAVSGHVVVQQQADVTDNISENAGGAIYLSGGATAEIRGSGTRIGAPGQGNRATNTASRGGGIYAENASLLIEGSNCWVAANRCGPGGGGGIYITNGTLVVRNDAVIGGAGGTTTNLTTGQGGGIFALASTVVITNGAHVDGNHSDGFGGGISLFGCQYLADGAVFGSAATAGNRGSAGGGFVAQFSSGTVANCLIEGNFASSGGGVLLFQSNLFAMRGTTVNGNAASVGGGMYVAGLPVGPVLDRVDIVSNTASGFAGVYVTSCGTMLMTNGCVVAGNVCASDVGGMYFGSASLDMHGGAVSGNVATNRAAGIAVEIGRIRCVDVDLCNNQAFAGGVSFGFAGAFYAAGADVTLEAVGRTVFVTNNSARQGAAFWLLPGVSCSVRGMGGQVVIAGNTSSNEGAVFCSSLSTATFAGAVLFSGNDALAGGAIFATNATVSLLATNGAAPSFVANRSRGTGASEGGGAICALGRSRLTARNAAFVENLSSNHGGAIWLRNATADIAGDFAQWPGGALPPVVLTNNLAPAGNGGAVHMSEGSEASFSDALFSGNSGSIGGAFRIVNSTADMANVVIFRNSSAVRTISSLVRSLHCTVVSNQVNGLTGTGLHSVSNCIVLGHSQNVDAGNDVQYSNIGGGYPSGTGNIDTNPLFYSSTGLDLRLLPESPCVGAAVPTWLAGDAVGVARPQGAAPDMGAFETVFAAAQSIAPAVYEFGGVPLGDTASATVDVFNSGTIALTGTVQNVLAPIFGAVPGSYTAPAFSSTQVVITFAPIADGPTWTNIMTFAGNGGNDLLVVSGSGIPEPLCALVLCVLLGSVARKRTVR